MEVESEYKKLFVNNRICPLPQIWVKVYDLLADKSDKEIMKPLILSAWHFTSDIEKKDRFIYHLEIAMSFDLLQDVKVIIGESETNWYHTND